MAGLQAGFQKHFEVLTAVSGPLVEQAQALRYQVYCLETGFEDASRFPDGRERDDFDCRSVHGLIRCRATGEALATVRLVLSDSSDGTAPFPMEACRGLPPLLAASAAPSGRSSLAEISRFAISKEAVARFHTVLAGQGAGNSASRLGGGGMIPCLTLGLFQAIVRMSADHGVSQWCAVMEPSLLRLLTRFGIFFETLGGLVDYHGRRQPCLGAVDEVLGGIYHHRREVWGMITLEGSLWAPPSDHRPAVAAAGVR